MQQHPKRSDGNRMIAAEDQREFTSFKDLVQLLRKLLTGIADLAKVLSSRQPQEVPAVARNRSHPNHELSSQAP